MTGMPACTFGRDVSDGAGLTSRFNPLFASYELLSAAPHTHL